MGSCGVGRLSKAPFDFSTENSSSQKAFQGLQVGEIIVGQETDGFAHGLGTAGTANSVHIILRMTGEVIVNHVGNAFHVDAASSDIGRYEDADATRFKILERAKSLILRPVGVESCTGDSQGFKTTGNAVGPVFRAGKDENGLHGLILQKMGKKG